MSRLSKKDLVRDFESGAIVAENERAKARRRMLGMLCFCVSNRNWPRCACFRAALEAKSLRPARTLGTDYTLVYLTHAAEI